MPTLENSLPIFNTDLLLTLKKKKKKSWGFIKTVMKYIDKNCVPALWKNEN